MKQPHTIAVLPALDGIPAELKGYPQWIVWKLETKSGGKLTKVPYSPRSGMRTGTQLKDRHTWGMIEDAVNAFSQGGYSGIGFVFTSEDPFVGIDLDHCQVDGSPNEWAEEIITQLDSYTESSPSGTGYHIIVKGKKPGRRCKRSHDESAIEIYDRGRYFTITGKLRWCETRSLINTNQIGLEQVYHDYLADAVEDAPPARPTRTTDVVTDLDLLTKIKESKNAQDFIRLFGGDMSAYDNDHSKADFALCQKLAFWTDCNPEQIDRLFRMSQLMRPKWDEKRGEQTYAQRTIARAIDRTTETYTPGKGKATAKKASRAAADKEVESENVVQFPEKKKRGGKKLRSCHIVETGFSPRKPRFDPDNTPWPYTGSYYRIDPVTGVLRVGETDDEPGEIIAQAPIWIHAVTQDIYHSWGIVIKFYDYDKQLIQVCCQTELLSDNSGTIGKLLRRNGMALISGKEKMVNRYLDQMANWCQRRAWAASKLGWFEKTRRPVFVMPETVVGIQKDDREVFYQPQLEQDVRTLHNKGSLENWKLHIADRARGNRLMMLAIMASLSAPLNKLASVEAGGFHFCGDTTKGKTACLQAGASVWGNASDPQHNADLTSIHKWYSTVNGMEAFAQMHNDIVMCLDEIGEADPAHVGKAIYHLTGGTPKGRSQETGGVRKQPTWHTVILSSGEKTIEATMKEAGQQQKGGQRHRMPDIRCDALENGIVENSFGLEPDDFVREFKINCSKYYGEAGPRFVNWLIQQIDMNGYEKFCNDTKLLVDDTEQNLKKDLGKVGDEIRRFLRRLACAGIAAYYAKQAGILDWSLDEVYTVLNFIRDLWMAEMGDDIRETDRALAYFRQQLISKSSCFMELDSERRPLVLHGFRNYSFIMVLPSAMDELCGQFSKRTVIAELIKRNYLQQSEEKGKVSKKTPQIANTQERPRCYWIHSLFLED